MTDIPYSRLPPDTPRSRRSIGRIPALAPASRPHNSQPMTEVGLFTSTLRVAEVGRACQLARQLGFRVVQFGKLADDDHGPAGVRRLAAHLAASGLTCAALCIVFDGES